VPLTTAYDRIWSLAAGFPSTASSARNQWITHYHLTKNAKERQLDASPAYWTPAAKWAEFRRLPKLAHIRLIIR
jgi:hypothetical protein